ncbi:PREDICTED: uncharacterized protein LOC106321338 [Brassica oleracea var. oleracea]|uniref:uncharacterized protein LOC106321338 n=1 Tax=Brassica oleracea var. oleracea TaxID=109376 RepID=UPI0006A6F567|nr:PREDICTED: uncharacterized protein LOC106321338 [Brassica oleracea var. oleracea]
MVDSEGRYSTEKQDSVQSVILYDCEVEALSRGGFRYLKLDSWQKALSNLVTETVALSSCEAEFMAGTEAARQAIWLQELLSEIMEQPCEKDNSLLKRAVVTQQKRHRETEDQNQELQGLRQMVTQYHEQLKTLEVNKYALTLHLKQALQDNSSIPSQYHLFLGKT